MKKYKTILFDIDDTLFDFDADQEIAFKNAMKEIGHICTDKMYEDYNIINSGMWEKLNEGKIELSELFIKRFEIFFDKYGIKQDEKEFDKILTKMFQKTGTPIKGVREVLESLKDKYELVISAEMFIKDKKIKQWFTEEQRNIIKEAIEDHRASINYVPRNIYGKIVSTADRTIIDIDNTIKRTYSYGKKNFPELSEDKQIERIYQHLTEKYGENGYAKIYLEDKELDEALNKLRQALLVNLCIYLMPVY